MLFSSVQEKVSALEKQARQLGQQASQECERLAKDRSLTLQMLQKVPKITEEKATSPKSQKKMRQYIPNSACIPGEGATVGSREEIPHPDRRKELPQVFFCHERGE